MSLGEVAARGARQARFAAERVGALRADRPPPPSAWPPPDERPLSVPASLDPQGYLAAVACDGREALRALRQGGHDVVLLDLVMPVMDGFEVLRTMKEDERLRSLPVIVVSALEEMERE